VLENLRRGDAVKQRQISGGSRQFARLSTGFGVPEHLGDGSVLSNLEIGSSGGCRFNKEFGK